MSGGGAVRYPWLDAYLLSLPGAEKRYHPAWKMFLYEVRGKLFAAVCSPEKRFRTYGGHDLVNLRCEPVEGEVLRAVWPELLPGFYTDKRTWIAALLDGELPDDLLRNLCAHSHALAVEKLPKYVQQELAEAKGLSPVEADHGKE